MGWNFDVVKITTLDEPRKSFNMATRLTEELASDSLRFHDNRRQQKYKRHPPNKTAMFRETTWESSWNAAQILRIHNFHIVLQAPLNFRITLPNKLKKGKHHPKTWHWCSNRVSNIWVSRTLLQPLFPGVTRCWARCQWLSVERSVGRSFPNRHLRL